MRPLRQMYEGCKERSRAIYGCNVSCLKFVLARRERQKYKRRKTDGDLFTIIVEQKLYRELTVRAVDKKAAVQRAMAALQSQGSDVSCVFVGYGAADERFGEDDRYDPSEDYFRYDIKRIEPKEDEADTCFEDGADGADRAEKGGAPTTSGPP